MGNLTGTLGRIDGQNPDLLVDAFKPEIDNQLNLTISGEEFTVT